MGKNSHRLPQVLSMSAQTSFPDAWAKEIICKQVMDQCSTSAAGTNLQLWNKEEIFQIQNTTTLCTP
jgi:hypothetical protein